MPWNDNTGGPGERGPERGPWGGGPPRQPWGGPPRGPQGGGQGPDLDDMLRRAREQFRNRWGGGSGGGGGRGGDSPRRGFNPSTIAAVLVIGWLATGIFIVDEGERGVISRFGAYTQTVTPGLHWHLPAPLESVRVISLLGQRRVEVGLRTQAGDNSGGQDVIAESLMITGDRNIVDIDFVVLYRLSDAREYLYNVANPEDTVRGLAESAMREVIGQRELQAIITTERAAVETSVRNQLQASLNSYRAGVEVLQVQLLKTAPPAEVVEAFNEVVRAGAQAESTINVASQYANEVVPRARGEAAQIQQAAEAYREQAVREANGEAQRFALVEQQYRAAPAVTRQRLYLESMERIYRNADTVIVDRNAGAVPFLPLDQLGRRGRAVAQPATPQAAAPAPGGNR